MNFKVDCSSCYTLSLCDQTLFRNSLASLKPFKPYFPLRSLSTGTSLSGFKHTYKQTQQMSKTLISFTVNPAHFHMAWECVCLPVHPWHSTLFKSHQSSSLLGRHPSLARSLTLNQCTANLLQYLSSLLVSGGLDNLDCPHAKMLLYPLLQDLLRGNWTRLCLQDGFSQCQTTAKNNETEQKKTDLKNTFGY